MNLLSKRMVSWEMAPTLETEYVISAVQKTIFRMGKSTAVIHIDGDIQYTSVSYYDETDGITKSYLSKANSW